MEKSINTQWKQSEQGSYFSHHVFVTYLGDNEPKYHVLKNPDGDGWVIGVFYSFVGGEYVPLEEVNEERLVFPSAEEAMNYVDNELEKQEFNWGDKLIYRKEFECLFVAYNNKETKESALVLLKGNSNVSIAHVSDLEFLVNA